MRHRIGIAAQTGLGGNPAPSLLDGQVTPDPALNALINLCAKEAHDLFFQRFGYCDAQYRTDEIMLGVEPAYQGDDLKIITINRLIDESLFITGHAFEVWGSGIRQKERRYGDYDKKSKFVRFVDRWHSKFFPQGRLL